MRNIAFATGLPGRKGVSIRNSQNAAEKLEAAKALSSLDEFVLLSVIKLNNDESPAYGATVYRQLEKWQQKTSLGTIHSSLARLNRRGYISLKLEQSPRPKPGGKKTRLAKVTPLGKAAAESTHKAREDVYRQIWQPKVQTT